MIHSRLRFPGTPHKFCHKQPRAETRRIAIGGIASTDWQNQAMSLLCVSSSGYLRASRFALRRDRRCLWLLAGQWDLSATPHSFIAAASGECCRTRRLHLSRYAELMQRQTCSNGNCQNGSSSAIKVNSSPSCEVMTTEQQTSFKSSR